MEGRRINCTDILICCMDCMADVNCIQRQEKLMYIHNVHTVCHLCRVGLVLGVVGIRLLGSVFVGYEKFSYLF